MPAVSLSQLAFMHAELKRLKNGEPTQSGMTKEQLEEFTVTPAIGLPPRVKPKKRR